jgi:hypothetical protein
MDAAIIAVGPLGLSSDKLRELLVVKAPCPQQGNNYDCGPIALLNLTMAVRTSPKAYQLIEGSPLRARPIWGGTAPASDYLDAEPDRSQRTISALREHLLQSMLASARARYPNKYREIDTCIFGPVSPEVDFLIDLSIDDGMPLACRHDLQV